MVPGGLYQIDRGGGSPFATSGLRRIQGDAAKQQKPDMLVYYDGGTTEVPTLVCPGHLKMLPLLGGINPLEIPFMDIERALTVVGSATSSKKKIKARCQFENCSDNNTFGVFVQRLADPRFPVPSEKRYFDFEEDIDDDCKTDCTKRAQALADKINADPMSIVVATVETTGAGATLAYWLVLEDKVANADFRAQFEGFDSYTVVTNASHPFYMLGNLREAYGPDFAAGKPDTTVMTATELVIRKLVVIGNSGGTSSEASLDANYEVQKRLVVVLTDAAVTNSAAAKTELDAILNGTKAVALYLDKLC